MKRYLIIRNLMLALTVLVATIPAVAIERPFAGNGSGLAEFIVNDAGQAIGANLSGSGTATHLGAWTDTATVAFTGHPTNPNLVIVSGQGTLTAANGDKLNFIVEGVSDVNSGIGTGQLLWAGGTGRFENASGAVSAVVQQNFASSGWELTMVGNIDY